MKIKKAELLGMILLMTVSFILLLGCEIGTDRTTDAPPSGVQSTPPPIPAKLETRGVTTRFEMDYLYIVGEVLNTTDYNIDFVKVVATLYNEAGTVIGTNFTYTELDIIVPNDISPFEISSYPDKIQPASYKLDVEYSTTSEQPFTGLRIKSHSVSTSREYYEIVGEVKNTSSMPAEFVRIVVTFRNSKGAVIGTDFTYADIDIVQAGSTAPFELSSYPRKISPASYDLQVQGRAY